MDEILFCIYYRNSKDVIDELFNFFQIKMYMMYYLSDEGQRVYTLAKVKNCFLRRLKKGLQCVVAM